VRQRYREKEENSHDDSNRESALQGNPGPPAPVGVVGPALGKSLEVNLPSVMPLGSTVVTVILGSFVGPIGPDC
jgi:hypothetical protein